MAKYHIVYRNTRIIVPFDSARTVPELKTEACGDFSSVLIRDRTTALSCLWVTLMDRFLVRPMVFGM